MIRLYAFLESAMEVNSGVTGTNVLSKLREIYCSTDSNVLKEEALISLFPLLAAFPVEVFACFKLEAHNIAPIVVNLQNSVLTFTPGLLDGLIFISFLCSCETWAGISKVLKRFTPQARRTVLKRFVVNSTKAFGANSGALSWIERYWDL